MICSKTRGYPLAADDRRMSRTSARPRLIGTLVLSTLGLLALLLPGGAAAAPEGGEAPLEVSPSVGKLPTTTVDFQSPAEEFKLAATGGEPVSIDGIAIEGAGAGAFWIDWGSTSCGGYQESCALWIVFQPHSVGAKAATVRIWVGGYEEKTFSISAEAVAPELTLEPSSLDFGIQQVYETGERQVRIENSGAAPVSLSGIDVNGPDSGRFWNGNSDCWDMPEGWLEPGASCTTSVYFQPDDVRDLEATLKVSVNEYGFTVPLSGRGGSAIIEPEANPVDLGAVTVGAVGELRTVKMTNVGDLPGAFFIAIIAGGDTASFELVEESCSGVLIEPGESCSAKLRFRPQGTGLKQARLALFGESDGGTMIGLVGEGVAPVLSLSPGSFDFGTVAAGTRGAAQPFAVRNGGSSALELGGVGIVGSDPDQFLLAGDECTGATLAAGQACQVRVRFAPDSAGAKAATLRVGAPGGALNAALGGTGTAPPAAAPAKAKPKTSKRKAKGKRRFLFRHNSSIHNRHNRKVRRGKRGAKKSAGKARRHQIRRLSRG